MQERGKDQIGWLTSEHWDDFGKARDDSMRIPMQVLHKSSLLKVHIYYAISGLVEYTIVGHNANKSY